MRNMEGKPFEDFKIENCSKLKVDGDLCNEKPCFQRFHRVEWVSTLLARPYSLPLCLHTSQSPFNIESGTSSCENQCQEIESSNEKYIPRLCPVRSIWPTKLEPTAIKHRKQTCGSLIVDIILSGQEKARKNCLVKSRRSPQNPKWPDKHLSHELIRWTNTKR